MRLTRLRTVRDAKEILQRTGGKLRFNIGDGFSVEQALNKSSANFSRTTAEEFRRVLADTWFHGRTLFYRSDGVALTADEILRSVGMTVQDVAKLL